MVIIHKTITGRLFVRKIGVEHPIEVTGAKLRAMMPWIAANQIVDKAKN
jgi:ketol-acid reductoisomerase